MTCLKKIDEILSLIQAASNEQIAEKAFARLMQEFGFQSYAHLDLGAEGDASLMRWRVSTFAEDVKADYLSQGLDRIDPALQHAGRVMEPFLSSSICDRNTEPVRQFFFENGFVDGLIIPVHARSPLGERSLGIGLLGWQRAETDLRRIGEMERRFLQLSLLYLHERYLIADSICPSDATPGLSIREIECLQWVAAGKTSVEISDIMGIAEPTVNFHLTNAMRRLGVYTRSHAAAKALAMGLIFV